MVGVGVWGMWRDREAKKGKILNSDFQLVPTVDSVFAVNCFENLHHGI